MCNQCIVHSAWCTEARLAPYLTSISILSGLPGLRTGLATTTAVIASWPCAKRSGITLEIASVRSHLAMTADTHSKFRDQVFPGRPFVMSFRGPVAPSPSRAFLPFGNSPPPRVAPSPCPSSPITHHGFSLRVSPSPRRLLPLPFLFRHFLLPPFIPDRPDLKTFSGPSCPKSGTLPGRPP